MSLKTAEEITSIIAQLKIKRSAPRPMWLWDAVGHILAQDLPTPRDIPPFNGVDDIGA